MSLSRRGYVRAGYSQTAGAGRKIGRFPTQARLSPARNRQGSRSEPLVMERRAADLLPLLDNWTRPGVETAIADSGVPLSFEEFRDLVREAAEGQPSACGRLCEIAPQIFRHVPKARGASLKVPTVIHALLLMIADDARRPAAYTYCPYEEDWVDRMTEATRQQLQQPRFSPIAARRLLKSQKWTHS